MQSTSACASALQVADVNISYLCKELSGMGFTVSKACIVPDAVPAIAAELRRIRADCEVVLTAGGTGPTLDDNTISAVAEALDVPLTRHPALEARLRGFYGDSLTDAHLKMAQARAPAVHPSPPSHTAVAVG
jgi:molybdopterin-biosynthesis enzyme MoeA-like protein